MSDPLVEEGDAAATPLSAEERDGLIPTYVVLRRELNELEQVGIDRADRWAFARRRDVLDEGFMLRLHKRMFGHVWTWAGQLRTSDKNIGIEAWRIEVELRQLLGDVRLWVDRATYPPDEIAVRLHHRLTQIHPFANGNGRFSRLAADLLVTRLGCERFTWGRGNLLGVGELRRRYVEALQAADRRHDLGPLIAFARS